MESKLKKAADASFNCQSARILLSYRTTPYETTGCTPGELLMGRKLRSAPRLKVNRVREAAQAEDGP